MSESFLYRGSVDHRRHRTPDHEFSYSLFMLYLDLGELPELFDPYWLWSARRWAPALFRREDHLGPSAGSLEESVRDRVETELGRRPAGPIRLLTNLRYWGINFNPVSFYYCFDAPGETIEALVAEVHNTPWREQHVYVLDLARARRQDGTMVLEFDKEFHVSPFLPMDLRYRLRAGRPGRTLTLAIRTFRGDAPVLDATLRLEREPISARTLRGAFCRYPAMTLKVLAGIYFEALRLWWKGAPYHPHPDSSSSPAEKTSGG